MVPKKSQDFRGVSLKTELVELIEQFIEEYPQYKSKADFVHEAVRVRMEEIHKLRPARLDYVNCDENGVKIHDRQLKEVVHILFKPKGILCEACEVEDCLHVTYAMSLPNVQDVIRGRRKQGWQLPMV